MDVNPYHTPHASGGEEAPDGVQEALVRHLRGAQPWLFVFAILSGLGAGLMLMAGIGVMSMSALMEESAPGVPMAAMGLMYVGFSVIYVVPAVLLFRAALAVGEASTGGWPGVEEAVRRMTLFWKGLGIITIAAIAISVVITALVVVSAIPGMPLD